LDDIVAGKTGPANILRGVARVVLQTGDMLLDVLNVPFEAVKQGFGTSLAFWRWVVAKVTGNEGAALHAASDMWARGISMMGSIWHPVQEYLQDVFGWEALEGYERATKTGKYSPFEYFPNNFLLSFLCSIVLDPLTYVGLIAPSSPLKAVENESLLMRLFADAPDLARTIRNSWEIAHRTGRLSGAYQAAKAELKAVLRREKGVLSRMINDAKIANDAGQVYGKVRHIAERLASIDDWEYFRRAFDQMRVSGYLFKQFDEAFRNILQLPKAERVQAWGRLLTASMAGDPTEWAKWIKPVEARAFAGAPVITHIPSRTTTFLGSHSWAARMAVAISEKPGARVLSRLKTVAPSYHTIDFRNPASAADEVYRVSKYTGFSESTARRNARRVAELAEQSPFDAMVYARNLENFVLAKSGLASEHLIITHKTIDDIADWIRDATGGKWNMSLYNEYKRLSEELSDEAAELVEKAWAHAHDQLARVLAEHGASGDVIDFIMNSRFTPEQLAAINQTINFLFGPVSRGDVFSRLKDFSAVDRIYGIMVSGDITPQEAMLLFNRVRANPTRYLVDNDYAQSFGIRAARYQHLGKAITRDFAEAAAKRLGGEELIVPAFFKSTRKTRLLEDIGPSRGFAYYLQDGTVHRLLSETGSPVPISVNQLNYLFRFRPELKDIHNVMREDLIARFGSRIVDEFNRAMEPVINIWKRFVVGKATYPFRSAAMNSTKLFLHGGIDPMAVREYDRILAALDPSVLDVVELAAQEALDYPFRYLYSRTDSWVGIRAAEHPREAIRSAYRYVFRDPVSVAYIKGGRSAAEAVLKTTPAGYIIAGIHGGLEECLNDIAKMIDNIQEYAPTFFDAVRYNLGAADSPGLAAAFLGKGSKRFSIDDLERIIIQKNEDFAMPYAVKRFFHKIPDTTLTNKFSQMTENASNLYSQIFGSGMRYTRTAGFKTYFTTYYKQLVNTGVEAESAAKIAANLAKHTINDVLMDFTKSIVFEHEYPWVMPFLSDLRLETISYMHMFRNNPKVFAVLRHWIDTSGRWIKERGYPQWARFSVPISIPGSKEKKWLNIPAFLLYPTLGTAVSIGDEGIWGFGKMMAQELSPLSEAIGKEVIKHLPEPVQNLPFLKDIKESQFYGIEPYGILTPGISGRGTMKEKMALYEKIKNLEKQAEKDSEVKSGRMSPLRFAIENLSPEERKMLDPAVNREMASVYKRIEEGPEAYTRARYNGFPILTNEELEEVYRNAVESLRGVLPGKTWFFGMLEPWLVPAGGTWTEEQMRMMGEMEQYRQAMKKKYGAASEQYPFPSPEIQEYSESLIEQKPWLRPMIYKATYPGGEASRSTWWTQNEENIRKLQEQTGGNLKSVIGGLRNAINAPFMASRVANPRYYDLFEFASPDVFKPTGDVAEQQERMNRAAKLLAWMARDSGGPQAWAQTLAGSRLGPALAEDRDFYIEALKAFGYDENGEPTRKLRLWQEWQRKQAEAGLLGEDVESYREFVKNWIREQEEEIPQEEQEELLNFRPYQTGKTALGLPTYPTFFYGNASPQYVPTGPVPSELSGRIMDLRNQRSVLLDMRKQMSNNPEVLAFVENELKRVEEELAHLEEQYASLTIPPVGAEVYPLGGLQAAAAIERLTGMVTPLQGISSLLGGPVPITTEQMQGTPFAELPPTAPEIGENVPTYNVSRYLKMAPEEREAYISGLKKIVSGNTYGKKQIELTPQEAVAVSGRTINELKQTNKSKEARGLGGVVYYPQLDKFMANSFPFDWLDPAIQQILKENSTPEEVAGFKLSGGGGGGGGRRSGRWRGKGWSSAGERAFSRGAPTPLDEYFMLPPNKREEYLRQHPELKQEWRKRKSGESDEDYKWRMYMMDLAEKYYGLSTRAARRDYLVRHPDLVAYFEGRRKNKDTYYMRAMARAFTHNPELWNRYLDDVHKLTEYFIEQKALLKEKVKTPGIRPSRQRKKS